jgi:transcriptional regulator EpsA
MSTSPPELDAMNLSPAAAQSLLRIVEAAPDVQRRYQFFTWLQGQVHPLLPHRVALCGAYSRQRRQLVFEVFNNVVLPPAVLVQMTAPDSPLLHHLAQAWVQGQGRPQTRAVADVALAVPGAEIAALAEAGVTRLVVHGVSLPDRLHEITSLFVLCATDEGGQQLDRLMDLVVHALHAVYLRALSFERELGGLPARPLPAQLPTAPRVPRVTAREAQILSWVREGMNNQQIGTELGISALTVKNHVQKILRKLGASNRAHAVALAMQWRLLSNEPGGGSSFGGLDGGQG